MPICPGCEQKISYDRLDLHERYCDGIWGANEIGGRAVERIERRLVALEKRVDGRIRDLEADTERRLLRIEKARKERRTTNRE